MQSIERRIRFWEPDSPSVTRMLRVDHEDCLRTSYSERFLVGVIYAGAFDGWYRGEVRTHVAGGIKLKEPGEVHRNVRIHAPFTLQGAVFSNEMVTAAASSLGLRGSVHFKASSFGPRHRATRLAFAMHAALVDADVPELERSTLVAETLGELLVDESPRQRGSRAVRLARAFLHDALASKITLDTLATHAGIDKFQLVRSFRAEVGLPPYEYLTYARVWKAKALLQRGVRVAEAAQTVGFYDESQLHRHFRRILGITPGRFSKAFAAQKIQHRPSLIRAATAHSLHE